jgi:hypothetical protein
MKQSTEYLAGKYPNNASILAGQFDFLWDEVNFEIMVDFTDYQIIAYIDDDGKKVLTFHAEDL